MPVQLYEKTRLLHEITAFTANQQQATRNPVSFGVDPNMRIDYLDIQLKGTLVTGGTEAVFGIKTKADRDEILDSLISDIRLFSSVVGDTIRSLSLSEVAQSVSFLNADFLESNIPRPGHDVVLTTAGTFDFIINITVPWKIANSAANALYAARCYQYPDGGLSFKTGDGSAAVTDASGGTVTWTVTGTGGSCTAQFRVRGPILEIYTKPSPIRYESTTTSGVAELVSGQYMMLQQYTDSAVTGYGASGGASAGMRIEVDGISYAEMSDFDPLNRLSSMISDSSDPAAFDLDCVQSGTGVAETQYVWDRVGVPVFWTNVADTSYNYVVSKRRIVIELGSNYTTTNTVWLSCRVAPLTEIADTPECPMMSGGTSAPIPNLSGPTSPVVASQNPVIKS